MTPETFQSVGNSQRPGPRSYFDSLFERLEASFAAQRHFIANASHELRTPLTRERTLLQVALAGPSTSDTWYSTGQELLDSNREQESIIESLLALATSEGEVERHDPIDLAVVAQAALGTKQPDADRLGVNAEATIGSASLEGDPDLIERLVVNLLDNAIGHNIEGGRVHLSIGTTDGHDAFSLSNTGPVIPPAEIDRLFQPFQRLDPRRAGHNNGHGLGLSIVQAIAAAHGAVISAARSIQRRADDRSRLPPNRRKHRKWPGENAKDKSAPTAPPNPAMILTAPMFSATTSSEI